MDFHFAIPSPLIVPRAHAVLMAFAAASPLGGCDASKAATPTTPGRTRAATTAPSNARASDPRAAR